MSRRAAAATLPLFEAIAHGAEGLKSRSRDPAERELIRTRAKLGEVTMRM